MGRYKGFLLTLGLCLALLLPLVSCSSQSSTSSSSNYNDIQQDYERDQQNARDAQHNDELIAQGQEAERELNSEVSGGDSGTSQVYMPDDCSGRSAGVICWTEADYYAGQVMTAQGRIVNAYDAGNAIFLDFNSDYQSHQWLKVIIWPENRQSFPTGNPAQYYNGRVILVRGLISLYQGGPQIEVSGPDQIEIVN
jgi:hypothetical protein